VPHTTHNDCFLSSRFESERGTSERPSEAGVPISGIGMAAMGGDVCPTAARLPLTSFGVSHMMVLSNSDAWTSTCYIYKEREREREVRGGIGRI